ncbi:MAG TPA: hypothetical protein VM346_03570 [Sphingomicrobium sp.]|nr:hypothetical protein [Sphingomicrobium sp.]
MIRIVQAEQIRFAEIERHEPQRLRMSSAQLGDGSRESLRIVEFE